MVAITIYDGILIYISNDYLKSKKIFDDSLHTIRILAINCCINILIFTALFVDKLTSVELERGKRIVIHGDTHGYNLKRTRQSNPTNKWKLKFQAPILHGLRRVERGLLTFSRLKLSETT